MICTALVNDNYPGTPNPLLYRVDVGDPKDVASVMASVVEQRLNDIGDGEELDLTLLMVLPGDLYPLADYRE